MNNFAVFTPTQDSIERLYKTGSNMETDLINPPQQTQPLRKNLHSHHSQRSLRDDLSDYKSEIRSQKAAQAPPPYTMSHPHSRQQMYRSSSHAKIQAVNSQIQEYADVQNFFSKQTPLTTKNLGRLNPEEMTPKGGAQLLHKLKSYKTNSTVEILQGLPLKSGVLRASQVKPQTPQIVSESFKKTISYPGLPWVQLPLDQRYQDPYGKPTFIKTLGAFRATGKESVSDMVLMSRSISQNLKSLLSQQTNIDFLAANRLFPVPKIVTHAPVQHARKGKRFLIAENDAHQRETNTGYSRKANGTFYNH